MKNTNKLFAGVLVAFALILTVGSLASANEGIKYSDNTWAVQGSLDHLTNGRHELQLLRDTQAAELAKTDHALLSTDQSICAETIVLAQGKYKDTSTSRISEEEKEAELLRLANVANQARNCLGFL